MADQPEPRMVSWAAAWTILGAVATLALATLPALFGVHRALIPVGAGLLGALVAVVGTRLVHGADLFTDMDSAWKEQVARWVRAAVVVHWGWVVATTIRPDAWFWWVVLLAGIAAGEYGFCRAHRYLLTTPAPTPIIDPVTGRPVPSPDEPAKKMAAALQCAGLDQVTVTGWEPIGDPPFGVRYTTRVHLPEVGRRIAPKLPPDAAETLAIALGEGLGTPLHTDWVHIEKQPAAGTYSIVVVTEDVMAKVRPYVDDTSPTSIRTPAMVGWRLDGTPQYLRLDQHGREVGQTRYGKTSLVQVKFAHITRCPDAVLWVGGVVKVYDLVSGWIEPFADSDHPLPIEWVTTGQRDVLDMLIVAMNEARWRQSQPMNVRGNWPTIIIELDEASFAARNRVVTGKYDGQIVTVSSMAAMLSQGAGSADVHVHRASQRSTNDHGGDQGADADANLGYTACFRSADWAEVGRTMGNAYYNLPTPRHPGVYWLTTDDAPAMVKAPYIQEMDRTKPVLHDGARISDVAWVRRDIRRTPHPAGSVVATSEAYRRRHTRANDAMLRYVRGLTIDSGETDAPMPDAQQAGYELARAEAEKLLAAAGLTDPTSPVTALEGRRSRAERIVDIVRDADGPMTPAEIVAALHHAGDTAAGDQVVTNALVRLVPEGSLTRPERGFYSYSESTNKQTNSVP